MSLTSVIADADHPLTCWLGTHLRGTAAVRRSYASAFPVRRVRRPVAAGRTVVQWDVLGVASDFRLRCAFVAPQAPPSACAGVALAGALGGFALGRLGEALVDTFEDHLRRFGPHRRGHEWLLDDEAEVRLDRMCVALAWFDRVYRDGVVPPGSPLTTVGNDADLDGLLAGVPDHAVMDLQVQARLAERALGALREGTDVGDCRAAPTFAGGADVGGADADLLVAHRLIEIKSVSRPDFLPDRAIWQLAGYALLDYHDRYRIDEVAFYMSRVGWLATWPTGEFFRLLGARVPLHRLRAQVAQRCASPVGHRPGHTTGSDRYNTDHSRRGRTDPAGMDRQERMERT